MSAHEDCLVVGIDGRNDGGIVGGRHVDGYGVKIERFVVAVEGKVVAASGKLTVGSEGEQVVGEFGILDDALYVGERCVGVDGGFLLLIFCDDGCGVVVAIHVVAEKVGRENVHVILVFGILTTDG